MVPILAVCSALLVVSGVVVLVIWYSRKEVAKQKKGVLVIRGTVLAQPLTTSDKYNYKVTNITLKTPGGRRSYNFVSTNWPELQGALVGDEVIITAYIQPDVSTVYGFQIFKPA